MDDNKLISLAYSALARSYSPYSGYKVGAALLCSDGTVYTGCNVENASYGATICAEQTAVVKAVSEGHRDFVSIAIVNEARDECFPCGICRQVLFEFSPELQVLCLDKNGRVDRRELKELLASGFRLDT